MTLSANFIAISTSFRLAALILVFAVLGLSGPPASAQTFTVLHNFGGYSSDGAAPLGALVLGTDGYLYGTTQGGGSANVGTLYKISTDGSTYSVLHNFNDGSITYDGQNPEAGLILGSDGNLYGTTIYGGTTYSAGTIFNVTNTGTVDILNDFTGSNYQGQVPQAALLLGTDGNLYGTTSLSEPSGTNGTVFKRSSSNGSLSFLHLFGDGTVTNDGNDPYSELIQGTDGNFYGTTRLGGSANLGTAFKISSGGTVTILHSFGDGSVTNDGTYPMTALMQGSDGNFYGTTQQGGSNNYGTAFKMTSSGTVTILHQFGGGSDGRGPSAALIQASDGNFYGVTGAGPGVNGYGTIFQMTSSGSETILHTFISTDGAEPKAALYQGSTGFYGTTFQGGSSSNGTIFEYTPAQASQTITFTLSDMPYTPNPITLNGVATSGLPVYYTKSGPANNPVGNMITLTGVGSLSVRAHQDGNAFYAAASSVLQVVNITQASQTISFSSIPNQTYPCSPITLNATASSGLAVYYTHSGPVSISGNTATITGTGSVGIRAHQDGNANYTAAPSVLQDFTVN